MTSSKLHAFFSGNCSDEEMLAIKEWAESSEENKKTLQRERVFYDILILRQKKKQTPEIITERFPVRKRIWAIGKAVAAAAVLLLTVYVSRYMMYEDLDKTLQVVSVPAGQYLKMELPDGTNVWLNAQTSMKYSHAFNYKKRHVILDGEAYFQVERDENLPFEVETTKGLVRVLGTEFNVSAYSDEEKFETALIKGKVEVSLKEDDMKIVLEPNSLARLHNGKLEKDTITTTDRNHYTWKEGILTFKDASFNEMMERFEKVFGIKIIIKSEGVGNHQYSGKFRVADGIDYALRVLQRNTPFVDIRDFENNTIYIESTAKSYN